MGEYELELQNQQKMMKVSRMAQEGLAFSSGLKNRLFDVGLKTR
jgi:hypothetical protein